MSVLCRHPNGSRPSLISVQSLSNWFYIGRRYLYCKGADSAIFNRLKDVGQRASCDMHLREFGREGLRTLVIACREVPEQEFSVWIREYQHATLVCGSEVSRREAVSLALAQCVLVSN